MPSTPENVTETGASPVSKAISQIKGSVSGVIDAVRKYRGAGSSAVRPQSGGSSYRGPSKVPAKFSGLGSITTPYRGSTIYEPGGRHGGIDIANKEGTAIPAFTGGTVTESVTGKRNNAKEDGFGNYIVVTDAQGNKHRYSHLQGALVPIGSQVQKGQVLGTMGRTGAAYSEHGGTGSHLDYRVYQIVDGWKRYVDPNQFGS